MVTVAGSVSCVMLLEAKETTNGVASVPPISTVPERVWPFQPETGRLIAMVASSSRTSIVATPLVQLSIAAVTVTGIGLVSIT